MSNKPDRPKILIKKIVAPWHGIKDNKGHPVTSLSLSSELREVKLKIKL